MPDEGRLLAERLVATWSRQTVLMEPAYAPPPEDPEAHATRLLHLETFADLALLCLTWKPPGLRPGLMEEVLAFLQDEGPFFDDTILQQMLRERQGEASYALKFLAGFINDALGLDPARSMPLSDRQRAGVTGRLAAELLTRMAYRTYEEHRATEFGARGALAYIERARGHDPENVRTELTAARFLLIAGHDDESRSTLAKLQRSARAREPEIHSEIEELRRILDERTASGVVARPSAVATPVPVQPVDDSQLAELEAEINRFPGAIQAYEELARKLATLGRFEDAIEWSERAMTQCLGRDGQLHARSLNMEVLGLRALWDRDPGVVRLYVSGAHRPALDVLETVPAGQASDHTLDYLLGQCRLALGRPEDAQLAFERALERCGRQLHRTVLRGLVMDVDQPYLVIARRSIALELGAGAFEPASRAAWAMMARLRHPEAAFVDLAQIHLDAFVPSLGTNHDALPAPTGSDLDFPGGERPRSRTMVGLDLHNAYARLGVSPLLPTDEIKEVINRKRKEVMRRRRTRGEQQFGEEEAEMTRLQAIEDEIGTPRARARYDRLNPQNALLTIQPAPRDLGLDPKHRVGLATAWLIEALGRASPLPSPESLSLWAFQGLAPDLVAFLSAFAAAPTRGTNVPEKKKRRAALPDIASDLGDVAGFCPSESRRPSHGWGTVTQWIITRTVDWRLARWLNIIV